MRPLTVSLMASLLLTSAISACAIDSGTAEDLDVASCGNELRTLQASEIVGNLAYGDSASVTYTYGPLYRAYRFEGGEGDIVSLKVGSPNGTPYVWLVDAKSKTLASARGPAGGEATIERTLAKTGTYYLVLRNRTRASAQFSVSLDGETAPGGEDIPTYLAQSEVNVHTTLQYGQSATSLGYTDASASYAGITTRAVEGDRLDIDVTGDEPVALLVDPDGKVVHSNQGASKATLRARATKTGTYTVAFRHAYFENGRYDVALNVAFATDGVDPFDPASCTGPAMTNADIASRLVSPAAAPGETFTLGNHTVLARTRSCAGDTCGPWSAPFAPVLDHSAYEGPTTKLAPARLVRAQNGAVELVWEQPGCYSLARGATCQIAPDGAFTCSDYKGSFHYSNTAWPGCYEGTGVTKVGSSRVKVALSGTIRQHCARAASIVRTANGMDVEVVSLVQY